MGWHLYFSVCIHNRLLVAQLMVKQREAKPVVPLMWRLKPGVGTCVYCTLKDADIGFDWVRTHWVETNNTACSFGTCTVHLRKKMSGLIGFTHTGDNATRSFVPYASASFT